MIAKEIAVKRTLEIIFEDDKEQFELFKFSLFSEFGEILPSGNIFIQSPLFNLLIAISIP